MSIYIYNSKNIKILQGLESNNIDEYVNATFAERKKANEIIQESYYRLEKTKKLNSVKAKRLKDCWSHIKIAKHRITNEIKLVSANSCRVRLCPACAWRRMRKYAGENARMLANYAVYSNYQYIFLTVTIKNVVGADLSDTLSELLEAWKRMCKRKRLKSIMLGIIRNLEITYNRKSKTYHPHIHAIIAVPPTYFGKDYINQKEWQDYWKDAIRIDYEPIIDVRKIRNITDTKAIYEISKYVAKISSFLHLKDNEIDEVIYNMDLALTNRRIISYAGIFKEWRREQKLAEDIEDEDITDLGDEWEIYAYQWIYGAHKYIQVDID